MKIEGMTIKNDSIELVNISMDFDNPGIYIIKGEVGCGKTTLMETILYGHKDILFEDEKEAKLYREDRASLFSYMSQYRSSISIKTIDFIKRDNEKIDEEKLRDYIERLDLDYDIINRRYDKLSGGEAVKIAFISAVLKDVPYIILDEPTNHLDDVTVGVISDIITEISQNHLVIVISHDVRFNLNADVEYYINKGQITAKEIESGSKKVEINYKEIRFNPFIIACKYTTKFNLFALAFIIIAVAMLTFFSNIFLIDEKYPDICTFSKDKICMDPEDVFITDSVDNNAMKFSDIKKIADMKGVRDIYIMDGDLLMTEDIPCWSVPYDFCVDMLDYIQCSTMLRLREGFYGSYPRDGKNEIVLSRYNYEKITGSKVADDKDMIGQSVNLACIGINKEFRVCGVIRSNMLWYSYSDEYQTTFFKYDPIYYDAVCEDIVNRRKKAGYSDEIIDNISFSVLLLVDSQESENITDNLKKEFPTCNPIGYYDYIGYYKSEIKDFALSAFRQNLVMTLICLVIIVFGNTIIIKENYRILREFENYYIDRVRIGRAYLVRDIIMFIVGCLLGYLVEYIMISKMTVFNCYETKVMMIILFFVYLMLAFAFFLTHYFCRRSVRHEITL